MKLFFHILLIILLFISCNDNTNYAGIEYHKPDWNSRKISPDKVINMEKGKSYLPVYSHVYQKNGERTFSLTITISIRNISTTDTAYILKADYFNTEGELIRKYLKNPVFVAPLETIEVIIAERDNEGGSGANFIFDWATGNHNPPVFEAVMISTYHQQGLSFITRGVNINED